MTRTVFDNHGVAHVWAQNNQAEGRSNNGNFYFRGGALFSYGDHFVVGMIMHDGRVFLNSDSYSISTSRHQSYARSAVSHRERFYIPDLTAVADALARIAHLDGDTRTGVVRGYCPDLETARRQIREFAVNVLGGRGRGSLPREMDDDSLRALLDVAGLGRSFDKIKREAARRIAKREAEDKAAQESHLQSRAEFWAGILPKSWKGRLPEHWAAQGETVESVKAGLLSDSKVAEAVATALAHDGIKHAESECGLTEWPWNGDAREWLSRKNRDALAAQKWAKGRKGWKTAHKAIQRRRAMVLAGMRKLDETRHRREAWRTARQGLARLRLGLAALAGTDQLTASQTARYSRAVRDAETVGIARDTIEREMAALEAMGGLVQAETAPSAPILARVALARLRDALAPLASYAANAQADRATRAGEIRHAKRLEETRQAREAWLNGDRKVRLPWDATRAASGGAFLRAVDVTRNESGAITGGTLETSQGASVPLVHAIRAFRFVKWCRETATEWHRNGRTVRVGFYQIDWVDAGGNFKAGCHRINWPEIEALATRLDLADIASDPTVAQARDGVTA